MKGHTYVEIGISHGGCLRQISAPSKIGVDPVLRDFGRSSAPGESLFEMTSDAFFADHAAEALRGKKVDVALVDGLHEFSQALRDILNLEKHMAEGGVIFIHDCNPPTREHAEEGVGPLWSGDVWKVCYYLGAYRPDLAFFTLDCDWGLGVLTGFRPGVSQQLPSFGVLEECKEMDYSLLQKRRRDMLRLRPAWYSSFFFRRPRGRRHG